MKTTADIIRRTDSGGLMPLITVDDFFEGNTDEESIAPNQWGYGRPPLAWLAERLHAIQRRADVAWVRVQLHPETIEMGTMAAEAVAVCTTAGESACTTWVAGFEAEVIPGLVDEYQDVPQVVGDARVWSIVWD